jgi:acyl carrier protein
MSQSARAVDVLGIVISALARQIGIEPGRIDADRPLAAVPGIESVHVLRALADVEDSCSVLVPDDFLFESATVRELANVIAELAEQR